MKKINGKLFGLLLFVALGALVVYINGCGGGGGDASAPASATKVHGDGSVAAAVTLTGRAAGRTAAQLSGVLPVEITIEGDYSEDGEPFEPIVELIEIDLSQGYAQVTIEDVPTGFNHLLIVVADWDDSSEEIVKALIPEVIAGETATVIADEKSTAVADAAIYYADQQGVSLSELDAEFIEELEAAIEALYQAGTPYGSITESQVVNYINQAGEPASLAIDPSTASVVADNTLQFSATLLDANGTAVSAADGTIGWSFDNTPSIGTIDSTGLFTAAAVGSGVITATYSEAISATAAVTVLLGCSIDTDCNDGVDLTVDTCSGGACVNTAIACNTDTDCDDTNTLTMDICTNGGTASATCANTAIACTTSADCDDGDSGTLDTCTNGGTLSAVCSNDAVACFSDTDCDDGDGANIDTCYYMGTADAICAHSTDVAAGSITKTTTWDITGSPYIVAGQVQVESGVTLTIGPGVEVHFDYPNAGSDLFAGGDTTSLGGIKVDGTLSAVGTIYTPITFTLSAGSESYGAGYWGGIYFTATSIGSALQYVNMVYPAYPIQIYETNVTLSNINITEVANTIQTSYHVFVKTKAGWKEVDAWHYGLQYQDKNMNLDGLLPDADGDYKVRIRQVGAHAAHVDSVQITADRGILKPVSAHDTATGEDVLYKLVDQDFDVADALGRTFEVTFEEPRTQPAHIGITMNAREEFDQVMTSGVPFTFPENRHYEAFGAHHHTYTVNSQRGALDMDGRITVADKLPEPAFATFVHPHSGHPDGTVYGYLKNDGRNLYATLDFTSDNTYDNDADYATLHVRVGHKYVPFKVSINETRFGQVGFNYTGNVDYQHKVYEFKIPLSRIGNPAPGEKIDYVFEAYGTSSLFGGAVTATYPGSGFTMTDVSLAFASGATGSMMGMYFYGLDTGSNTLNNISISGATYTGMELYSPSGLAMTNVSIDGSEFYGMRIYNGQDVTCTNCSVTNSGADGFNIDSSTNVSLSGCVANNSGGNGIYIFNGEGAISVMNCDMSFNSSNGYYINEPAYNGSDFTISNSRASGNCNYGVEVYDYGYGQSITFNDSNLTDNASYGIYGYGSATISALTNVYIAGNNGAAAGVADTSTTNPNSNASPQQYVGVGSVTTPATTEISGPPTTAGSATCGYY